MTGPTILYETGLFSAFFTFGICVFARSASLSRLTQLPKASLAWLLPVLFGIDLYVVTEHFALNNKYLFVSHKDN